MVSETPDLMKAKKTIVERVEIPFRKLQGGLKEAQRYLQDHGYNEMGGDDNVLIGQRAVLVGRFSMYGHYQNSIQE